MPTLSSPSPPRIPPIKLWPASPANGRTPGRGWAAASGGVRGGTCDNTLGVVPRGAADRTLEGWPYSEPGSRSSGVPADVLEARDRDRATELPESELSLDSRARLSLPESPDRELLVLVLVVVGVTSAPGVGVGVDASGVLVAVGVPAVLVGVGVPTA